MLRNPDSIPTGDTIIEDPILEPYFITKSQAGGYVVYKRVVRGENDNEYLQSLGYPSTFNYSLKMVAKEMLNDGSERHYTSIQDYIKEWEKIQNKLGNLTSIDI
tara:strand:- start:329 stop:640 length:312 start_codon:yes stop_codon:yes gene_type:complete